MSKRVNWRQLAIYDAAWRLDPEKMRARKSTRHGYLLRMSTMQRGILNIGKTGITGTPVKEQDWTLDPTGNWTGFVDTVNGAPDLDQTRTASTVNEVTNISASGGTSYSCVIAGSRETS
jgi:hypothetical protein